MPTPLFAALPDSAVRTELHQLVDRVRAEFGYEPMPESLLAATRDPSRAPLVAISTDGFAAATIARSDSFHPAYRQLGVVATTEADPTSIAAVIDAALAEGAPSAEVVAWIPGADPRIVGALQRVGFRVDREQHQMRVPLPPSTRPVWPAGIRVEPFRVGTDETAWLAVNNRAFHNHPDQGGWIASQLDRRMAEDWFDPAGFLLAWRGDELVGFCWTKVHTEPERLGEIFVIGVDPDAQGLGLGRTLVTAGLEFLAAERGCPIGVLYVAANNTAAIPLYESMGFTIGRTDTALVLDATPLDAADRR